MIRGIDPGETKDYICKEDRGTENPTIFKLGVLDAFTLMDLEDRATNIRIEAGAERAPAAASADFKWNQYQLDIVRFGLKGWENFLLEDGRERPFNTKKHIRGSKQYQIVSDETLAQLPIRVIRELADVIMNWNQLSEEEAKNSD